MCSAVMNDTLRLTQPVVNLPKSTLSISPQQITMDGMQYTITGNACVLLSIAVHRNFCYWLKPNENLTQAGLDHFHPERWFAKQQDKSEDDLPESERTATDLFARLFKPVKGSYIPFSERARACIGKRFSQVELLAAFALIFSQYSIELAVADWASDAEVEAMPIGGPERKRLWQKGCGSCEQALGH